MRRDLAPMEAGDRDRDVTIEARTATEDASGFPTETWATLVTPVWMSHAAKGSERFIADQESAKADGLWEMGYRSDMDPELVDVPRDRRLVWQGRAYDIVAASCINRHEGVQILTLSKNG